MFVLSKNLNYFLNLDYFYPDIFSGKLFSSLIKSCPLSSDGIQDLILYWSLEKSPFLSRVPSMLHKHKFGKIIMKLVLLRLRI